MTTLDAVRAAALFAGDLQPGQHPGPAQVRRTVTAVLHRRGAGWCTARVAEEFEADPHAAAQRLAWALRVIRDCYARITRIPVSRCRAPHGRPVGFRPYPHLGWAPRCRYPVSRYRRPGP
ncbi:MAG: hypothetical protein E6F99_15920 [Actinobacteria bacterium]|nr:MAG: hypothetical protein E6F99_15920 [Actinomycetota bacterium]